MARGQRVSRERARINAEKRQRHRSGSGHAKSPHKRKRNLTPETVESEEARYSTWYTMSNKPPELREGERLRLHRKTLPDGTSAVGFFIRKAMTQKERDVYSQQRRMDLLKKNVFFHPDGKST